MWHPTHVQVSIIRARNLITKAKNGTNDCFVLITLDKQKYQTTVKEKAQSNVEWNEDCELSYNRNKPIKLTVLHRSVLAIDEFIGQCYLDLADFDVYERPKTRWCNLQGKSDKKASKYRGELEVCVSFKVCASDGVTTLDRRQSFLSVSNLSAMADNLAVSSSLVNLPARKKSLKKIASSIVGHAKSSKKKKEKLDAKCETLSDTQSVLDLDSRTINEEDEDPIVTTNYSLGLPDDDEFNTSLLTPLSSASNSLENVNISTSPNIVRRVSNNPFISVEEYPVNATCKDTASHSSAGVSDAHDAGDTISTREEQVIDEAGITSDADNATHFRRNFSKHQRLSTVRRGKRRQYLPSKSKEELEESISGNDFGSDFLHDSEISTNVFLSVSKTDDSEAKKVDDMSNVEFDRSSMDHQLETAALCGIPPSIESGADQVLKYLHSDDKNPTIFSVSMHSTPTVAADTQSRASATSRVTGGTVMGSIHSDQLAYTDVSAVSAKSNVDCDIPVSLIVDVSTTTRIGSDVFTTFTTADTAPDVDVGRPFSVFTHSTDNTVSIGSDNTLFTSSEKILSAIGDKYCDLPTISHSKQVDEEERFDVSFDLNPSTSNERAEVKFKLGSPVDTEQSTVNECSYQPVTSEGTNVANFDLNLFDEQAASTGFIISPSPPNVSPSIQKFSDYNPFAQFDNTASCENTHPVMSHSPTVNCSETITGGNPVSQTDAPLAITTSSSDQQLGSDVTSSQPSEPQHGHQCDHRPPHQLDCEHDVSSSRVDTKCSNTQTVSTGSSTGSSSDHAQPLDDSSTDGHTQSPSITSSQQPCSTSCAQTPRSQSARVIKSPLSGRRSAKSLSHRLSVTLLDSDATIVPSNTEQKFIHKRQSASFRLDGESRSSLTEEIRSRFVSFSRDQLIEKVIHLEAELKVNAELLKQSQNKEADVRSYLDGLLVRIMDMYPELLHNSAPQNKMGQRTARSVARGPSCSILNSSAISFRK